MSNPQNFCHPYEPYDIQKQLMNAVYDCLDNGKVGIFESPTGTGKSLSLICGSLTWLREKKRKLFEEELVTVTGEDEEPEWMVEYSQRQKREEAVSLRVEVEARLDKVREKERRAKARFEAGEPPVKKQKLSASSGKEESEDFFALADYESEDEQSTGDRSGSSSLSFSVETNALMEKLGMSGPAIKSEADVEIEDELKIFYCSRTHSQLTQFVNELRRVKMPRVIQGNPLGETSANEQADTLEEFKHLTLGSRKNLCINSRVSKLGSTTAINERCLELQQPGTPVESKCTFLPNRENEVLVNDFRDHTLAKIRDIEDLGALGKKIGVCPYYASRASVRSSEIVTLPYQLLLQRSARDALGLSLKGHVVIIDEAHNLMDTISNIHSVIITLSQLDCARSQLGVYLQKFRNKLKGKNRVYVTQLVRLVDSLSGHMQSKLNACTEVEGQVLAGDLMTGKGVDQINMYKLMRYLQESKLARKVDGYIEFSEKHETSTGLLKNDLQTRVKKPTGSMPVLTHIQSFLLALTYPTAEGRFFYAKSVGESNREPDVTLKYLLLDPTHHFKEIVEEARSVILVGGTMSPMDDYINYLLQYLPPERIQTLSCGHVIPSSNLLALPIAQGPNGIDFEFSFGKRSSHSMIRELGLVILDLAKRIPDGFVIFFPSYTYLDTAVQYWTETRINNRTIIDLLSSTKRIFSEPRSTSSQAPSPFSTTQSRPPSTTTPSATTVDEILAAYTAHVTSTNTGALLLAVIGGSLSEGINFSDRLGRGVAVVGLPFPNPHSAEWKAKLEYVEQRSNNNANNDGKSGDSKKTTANSKAAAREYLENACMRAVNQSVGRAIRHKGDFAAVFLLDGRYGREGIRGKLPGWIRESVVRGVGYADGLRAVERFFTSRR